MFENLKTMSQSIRSNSWDYFVINGVDETKANCSICKEKLKRGGNDLHSFGTTALIAQLLSKHRTEFKEYLAIKEVAMKRKLEVENEKQSSAKKKSLLTVDAMFEKKKQFDRNHPRQVAITRKIGEMIASDVLPFNVVNGEGFIRLLNELEPRYIMLNGKCQCHSIIN